MRRQRSSLFLVLLTFIASVTVTVVVLTIIRVRLTPVAITPTFAPSMPPTTLDAVVIPTRPCATIAPSLTPTYMPSPLRIHPPIVVTPVPPPPTADEPRVFRWRGVASMYAVSLLEIAYNGSRALV